MIKKLNVFLLVAVAVMLSMKFVMDFAGSAKGVSNAGPVSASAGPVNAGFAPRIVYEPMEPLAVENPLNGRNGYLLDLVKSVFPKGRLDDRFLDIDTVRTILTNDPNSVCISYGDHPRLRDFPHAPTPLFEVEVAVYTRRSFEWSYTGPESLKKIRLGITEGYEDSAVLRGLIEESEKNGGSVKLFKHTDRYYSDPLMAVQDGVVDAMAQTMTSYSSEMIGITASQLVTFNVSPAIDRVPLYLIVSNADPEHAKRLIEAYESGLKSIEASGVLRRLREYYRLDQKN